MNIKIDVVKTYRIKGGNHYVFRRTLKGAFSKLAWWMIFDKYTVYSDYKVPSGKECECWTEDGYPRHDECELHDRYYGYYKRVHTRLVLYLINRYESEKFPADFSKEKL